MITKANDTVLDLGSRITPNGKFEKLSVADAPVEPNDVVNKEWAEGMFVSLFGESKLLYNASLNFDDYLLINAGGGNLDVGPTIDVQGSAFLNASHDLYLGAATGSIHLVTGSKIAAEAKELLCLGEDKLESNVGALIIRSPDRPGSPDPSPYILLEPMAPGEPASLGGTQPPAIVMRNPDQPAQAYPYEYTKISNRDGTILQVEGDTTFGGAVEVRDGTPIFAIKQNNGIFFDFFMNVLKRVKEPVDDDDAATKRYVDSFGGTVFASSSFGQTGYVVFKGGLILQWGAAPEAPGGVATVTLPITWSTGFMVGFCAAEVGGGDTKVGSVISATPSQVTVKYNGSGTPVTPVAGSWIALGY